ncbi:MAG TPA: glycosyltransferase family 39 protein [bacterium]|nr:glycosyltransferase family 39 protein [bacterium]HOM26742.1 glycosyltransferase family 39 protein [bacterium]
MKNVFEILILSFFIFFSGYFPARFLTQNLPFEKEEKFILNFAFSFFLFYIVGFLSYVFNSNFAIFNGIFLLIFLFFSFFYILKNGFDNQEIKFLKNFFIIFLVFILYQTLIPLYFGGLFYWDWFEHFLRSIFFLDRLPKDIVFEGYIIPSRPPFFNIVCFFYLSITGGEFYKYQIVSTFLNSMLILSVYLFCKEYLKIENKYLFLIVCVVMFLNPAILRQITYTWTKAFCAFYVILGLYFYLKFLKNQNSLHLFISSFLFGIGFIVHFSAGCYIVPVFLHLAFRTILNKNLIKKTGISYLIFLFVIFTYFSWSIKNYGVYKSFFSTNIYQQQKNISLIDRIEKDSFNFIKTLHPFPLKYYKYFFNNSPLFYKFFNYLHPAYVCTLPGSLTFSLTFFLLILFLKNIKQINLKTLSSHSFLIFFFFLSYLLDIVVMPLKELSGLAHTGLLPLTCLFICFGIKYILSMPEKNFFIFSSVFLIETLFILTVFTIAFNIYSDPQRIISLGMSERIDSSLISNFLLKYYNHLVFLHDKISIFK